MKLVGIRAAALLLNCVLVASCATPELIAQAAPTAGRAFRLDADCESASPRLVPVLTSLRFRIEAVRPLPDGGLEVIASKHVSALSWGELVRARVACTATGSNLIVLTERVVSTNIAARGDWSMPIYEALVNDLVHQARP